MPSLRFLGILLSSSWINMMIFALEIVLVYRYFSRFLRYGPYALHVLVAVILLVDAVGTIGVCASTWLYLVVDGVDPIKDHLWTMPLLLVATSLSAVLEQTFLIYRFHVLSHARSMTAFLLSLVTFHMIITTWCAVNIALYPVRSRSGTATITFILGASTAALVDLLIPGVLIWQLQKINSSLQSTQCLIRRVSIQAVSSGTLVAFLGVIAMTLFALMRTAFLIFWFPLGRVYGITVLINLLARHRSANVDEIRFPSTDLGHSMDDEPSAETPVASRRPSKSDAEDGLAPIDEFSISTPDLPP
ncbi:hypothetical protein Hypma_013990 [Hypsizygus marmoreus]|uniref:DUF6534 domain-containing protein n=1 Tax=Hypsizygus marmoreus TaxID=39966 RepID=A0A369KDR4_HYPMA|nr:hypothetical protein Hypma_013990 [Hypsizygus marmoreus]